MNIAAPPAVVEWFTHRRQCADPAAYVFEHRDGTPGVACESCGRTVALRSGVLADAVRRALRLEQGAQRVEAARLAATVRLAPARFVLACIDCGAAIALHRGDRPCLPLCERDRGRREQLKNARQRGRR